MPLRRGGFGLAVRLALRGGAVARLGGLLGLGLAALLGLRLAGRGAAALLTGRVAALRRRGVVLAHALLASRRGGLDCAGEFRVGAGERDAERAAVLLEAQLDLAELGVGDRGHDGLRRLRRPEGFARFGQPVDQLGEVARGFGPGGGSGSGKHGCRCGGRDLRAGHFRSGRGERTRAALRQDGQGRVGGGSFGRRRLRHGGHGFDCFRAQPAQRGDRLRCGEGRSRDLRQPGGSAWLDDGNRLGGNRGDGCLARLRLSRNQPQRREA